jgi:hypothetical protein
MQHSEINTDNPPRHVAIFYDETGGHLETHSMDEIYRRRGRDQDLKYLNAVWPEAAVECRCFDNDFIPPMAGTRIERKRPPLNDNFSSGRMFRAKGW